VIQAIELAQKRPQPPTQAWTAKPYYQGPVTPSQMEELTYAWHLAYVKSGWEEPQKKQIADLWKDRFSTFRGGNLYNGAVSSIRQTTMQNSGQGGVSAGGETEEELSGPDSAAEAPTYLKANRAFGDPVARRGER